MAAVDKDTVCAIMDDFHPNGAVALASSYDYVGFDNLRVKRYRGRAPRPAPEWENLALGSKVTASSESDLGHDAAKAVDGNHGTGWCPGKSTNQWLELDLGKDVTFSRVTLDQHKPSPWVSGGDISSYRIVYWRT